MKRILVLCTGNSARSQMAHGYLHAFAGDKAEVYSAGVAPHGVNPMSVQVMAEDGVDISHHTSNHVDEYMAIPFDNVITVCDNAREQCPFFPSSAELIHQSFPDPGHQPGIDAITSFRQVRDQIKAFSYKFVVSKWPDQHHVMIKPAQTGDRVIITHLLQKAALLTEDLPEDLSDFVIAEAGDQIIGVAGLEIIGSVGLLRSVAVDGAYQGRGVAGLMIHKILGAVNAAGIQQLYLITTTADEYFKRFGFSIISREQIPEPIQQTRQLSSLCPSSAIVMQLTL